jgi:hypothetical protein
MQRLHVPFLRLKFQLRVKRLAAVVRDTLHRAHS